MPKYAIFHINHHSPDRDLIGTMVINSFSEKYPEKKIIVVTNFPDIWLHNPRIFRVYKHGNTPYFYDTYIKDGNSLIFAQNPAHCSDFLCNKKSLVQVWCEMCGIEYNNSLPEIYLTQREEELVQRIINSDLNLKKQILIFQPFENYKKHKALPITWPKDISEINAQKIVNMAKTKNYNVIQISNNKQPKIIGATYYDFNLRLTMALIKNSEKIICVDSFIQHLALAFNKKTFVVWISSNPLINGYSQNKNHIIRINTELKTLIEKFNYEFDFDCKNENIAFSTDELLNLDEINRFIYE